MNIASLELGLLLLGDPPYSDAQAAELVDLVTAHAALNSIAGLTRLEHQAAAMASGDPAAALELAARLESVHSDTGCWLRAALLEASGRFAEAAGAMRFLREKAAGEERAMVMLASARNLFAAGHYDRVWYPLAEACNRAHRRAPCAMPPVCWRKRAKRRNRLFGGAPGSPS